MSNEAPIEKVRLLTAQHLDAAGLDYAEALVEVGSNHGRLPFGFILLVPESADWKGCIVGEAPASLLAVFDAARKLDCAWIMFNEESDQPQIEGLRLYEDDDDDKEAA